MNFKILDKVEIKCRDKNTQWPLEGRYFELTIIKIKLK